MSLTENSTVYGLVRLSSIVTQITDMEPLRYFSQLWSEDVLNAVILEPMRPLRLA